MEGEEGEVGEDGDSISLRGVMGERALPATSASKSQQLLRCTVQVFHGSGIRERAGLEPALRSSYPQLIPSHLWGWRGRENEWCCK